MAPLPDPTSTATSLRFGAGLSGHLDPAIAAEQACDQCLTQLGDRQGDVDLAFVFISDKHGASAQPIAERVRRGLGAGCLIGVSACGIAGGEAELEEAPGVSILAASLPGVKVRPFRTDWLPAVNVNSDNELAAMAQAAGMVGDHRATFLFADPFSVPMGALLPTLTKAQRFADTRRSAGVGDGDGGSDGRWAAPILGGMASAGRRPDTNVFILNDELSINGGVGVSLSNEPRSAGFAAGDPRAHPFQPTDASRGAPSREATGVRAALEGTAVGRGGVDVTAVVSQGCRPIGPRLVVTACKKQILLGLAGRSALEVLAEVVASLSEHERELLKTRGLFLGRAVNEYKERFGLGDFLIRNVIGVDKTHEAIAVAELLRVGQTVQFHVRDDRTADEDLALLLDGQKVHEPPLASLLFTCNGRGKELFGAPHHDARAVTRAFTQDHAWTPSTPPSPGQSRAKPGRPIPAHPPATPSLPLAGFFAAGEIGPVGDEVFVHGQTACIALFREAR